MKHTLPKLPYKELPGLSATLFKYHHGKHHNTYVDNLNKLIKDTEFESSELVAIIQNAKGKIFNNAAQHWNHSFYWKCMTDKETEVSDPLKAAIDKKFKSMDAFKEKFISTAMEVFGSGWCALVEDGALMIKTYKNADTPIKNSNTPLLIVDMWEHSWYIQYHYNKQDYLNAFWEVINWKFVSDNWKIKHNGQAKE